MIASAVSQTADFQFRMLAEEKLERLSEMFRLCFGLAADEAYFRWKYLDNPAGKVVAYEALDGDVPAAFYGVIPELWKVDGKVTRIYQSMDTATHPNYQRRGLFGKLAAMTYQRLLDEDGHAEIIGFPGPQSYPGFVNKLGWKRICDIRYVFTTKLMNVARAIHRKRFSFDDLSTASDLDQLLLDERRPQQRIAKHLTREILEWRVFRNPLLRYEVVAIRHGSQTAGFCVYRVDTPRSCCIEWLELHDPSSVPVAALADHLLARSGRRYLYTWEPNDHIRRAIYRAAGFIRNPFRRGPFAGTLPYIVYSVPEQKQGLDWFDARNYELQPLVHD